MYLFGPVLRYDLVRTARRARYFVMRFFFALVLFLTLYVFYSTQLGGVTTERAARQKLIDFAEFFGYAYIIIQYLLVLLMTPAYVGSAISEEKERRTMEFLLATDLRSQEIIFGKLASRVGNILMFLLAGLPVLAFVQFFGGLDPDLLLMGFTATLMTVLSISAVSLYCSVHAKHSRDGIMRSYLMVVGYFVFGGILAVLFNSLRGTFVTLPGAMTWKLEDQEPTVRGLAWFTEVYLTGDIFHAIFVHGASRTLGAFMSSASWTGVDLGSTLRELNRNYLIFHGTVFFLCLLLSILRLRPVFLQQTYGEKRNRRLTRFQVEKKNQTPVAGQLAADNHTSDNRVSKKEIARGKRWRLGEWPPMVWKELLVPKRSRRTLGARIWTGVTWAAYLLLLAFILIYNFQHGHFNATHLGEGTNWYARIAGSILMSLIILGIGLRAAVAVGVERDKQTLETLLSTILTDRQIMFGKWVGSLGSIGSSAILLLIIWITCILSGGLSLFAIPFLLACLLVYGSFAAAVGLFFSAGGKTTTRALLGTLFWLVMWGGAHLVFVFVLALVTGFGKNLDELYQFFLGQTPPFVMGTFAFRRDDLTTGFGARTDEILTYCVLGLIVSGLLALLFFFLACQRFYLATGRVHTLDKRAPRIRPAPSAPAPE